MTVRSVRVNRKTICSCLEQCAPGIQETGAGRWSFVLSNGALLPVVARTDEDWLIVEAPVARRQRERATIERSEAAAHNEAPSAWTWLELNARLDGAAKIAALPDSDALFLRSDIPLHEDVDLARRLQQTCADFIVAADSIAGHDASEHDRNETAAAAMIDLAGLCRDAGWPAAARDGGTLVVDVGVAGRPELAVIEQRPNGAVGASVELVPCHDLTPASRDALGVFLLRACGIVRMARAVVQEEADKKVARLEVRYPSAPCAAEVAHALSALSVACTLFGREALALRDERVARTYRAIDGWRGTDNWWHRQEETWTR